MTLTELTAEFDYRYQERLGILCEDREPTEAEKAIAHAEAYAAIIELNQQSRKKQNII